MITYEYLTDLIEDWIRWMKHDRHKLGYPQKSIGLGTGGSSVGVFEEMCEKIDSDNIELLNTAIYDLDTHERNAFLYRYLKQEPKPAYYELKLQFAMESLLKKLEDKIYV